MAFQGSLKELPLPDIIQLVSVSGKTGVFELKKGAQAGEIFLRDGQIVHATAGSLAGEEAVYELAVWTDGEFLFQPSRETATVTIKRSNTNLLMEAARRIDEWQILSKRIPSTRLVPVFTEQAKRTSVSLTPAEWQLIAKIDERRSVEELSVALKESPFDVCKNLYGLITSGLVALEENLSELALERVLRLAPPHIGALLDRIQAAATSLASGESGVDLDAALRLSRIELDSGRGLDAVVDLVRSSFKAVHSVGGGAAAESFRDQLRRLLAAV